MTHARLRNVISYYNKSGYRVERCDGEKLFSKEYGDDAPVLFKIRAEARAKARELARALVVRVAGVQFRR